MRFFLSLVLLTGVYALTLASADPLDLLAGVVISAALLVALRPFLFRGEAPAAGDIAGRVLRFPVFALAVVVEVTRGTWQVARVVVDRRRLVEPGIVAVPIGDRTRTGVAATALAVTLSPGEVFVEADWTRRVMLLHVIDASDPEAVRRHHADFYDRYQRGVFP
jgi:multicomponent Na+:H+ antiporter subunit E